jgi:hypothetical protein
MPDLDGVSGLDTMLREAAGDAARRAAQPSYSEVRAVAQRRRTAKGATAGAFGVVLSMAVGVTAVAGLRDAADPDPRTPAAASSAPLDPSLQQYVTTIPVLAWGPVDGRTAESVSAGMPFLTAVFAGFKPVARNFSDWPDLRKTFPDAPIGGNAVVLDGSFTRSEIEAAAANVRKLDGVKYARVVDVKGLWFTLSASAPGKAPSMSTDSASPPSVSVPNPEASTPPTVHPLPGGSVFIDLDEFHMGNSSGADRHGIWARATFVGPSLSRADFDLMRRRAAEALHIDVSQVVVKAESAGPAVTTTK